MQKSSRDQIMIKFSIHKKIWKAFTFIFEIENTFSNLDAETKLSEKTNKLNFYAALTSLISLEMSTRWMNIYALTWYQNGRTVRRLWIAWFGANGDGARIEDAQFANVDEGVVARWWIDIRHFLPSAYTA